MKNLILFLAILITTTASAQRRVGEYYRQGSPTTTANVNDLSIDTKAQKVYEYYTSSTSVAVANRWRAVSDTAILNRYFHVAVKGDKGDTGATGAQGIQGVKGDKGDTGAQGIQGVAGVCPSCPPSSGGGTTIPGTIVHNPNVIETLTQIQVGGTGTNQTASGYTYSGITVTSTDLYDWANIQYGIYLANLKKKQLISVGKFHTAKMVDIGRYTYALNWDGLSQTEIITQNNNAYQIVGRPDPTSDADANQYIQATYTIKNIKIKGGSNQVAFAPGPSYSSVYESIRINGAKTGMHLRFSLNTNVINCDAGNVLNGFIADYGNWPDATTSNSQSNQTTFTHCHATSSAGLVGFGIYASSGTALYHCIVEGVKFKVCVDFDSKGSTNVKDFYAHVSHLETVQGNNVNGSESFYRIRMSGQAEISGIYSQYSGTLIDAGTSVGQLLIVCKGVTWAVAPADGKLFYNAGNTLWQFYENTDNKFLVPANMPAKFGGVPVTQCGSPGCGLNKFTLKDFGQ